MLQDPISKPPDVQLDVSRPPTDRRHKANSNPEQVLKCPRCESMNTKFCYYNNYSLTQPRHFCKNCRRYWTQGGSLRNVPVGGGCRKNKRVKQRTVDPHSLVSLDETASSMLASLHSSGAAGFLPTTSFQPAPGPAGFGDLVPSNDSHMLSMAFSRLQESLRLGEHSGAGNRSQLSLMSNMQSSPYESGLVYTSASVKPEHGAVIYNGSELGSLFDPGSHLAAGSATATLATLEDQLTNFGVPVDAFNACTLEAQLKLQHQHHQKQLALHLGADHHMHTQHHHNNNSGSVVDRAANHHALPDFEDHESPETINMMRRHATKGRTMMGIDGRSLDNWHQAPATNEGNMGGENIYEPVNAAADNQSFWSHSPWTDVHTLTGSTAGALL